MKSIKEIEKDIAKEFDVLGDDWTERYGYLIEIGRQLDPLPMNYKNDVCLVRGCQSQVWVHTELRDGKLYLLADSDALIVKGLLALIVRLYNAQSPQDILNTEIEIFDKIGLTKHLSPSRTNGLLSVINFVKEKARAIVN